MTLLLFSCNSAPGVISGSYFAQRASHGTAASGTQRHSSHATAAVPAALNATEFSIYDLEAQRQDQQALTLQLKDLAGRPRVVALVCTSCAYACPRILADMKRMEGEMRAAGIDAGYVMASIDPARDTPQHLHEYAVATQLDPDDWTLLTGTRDGTLELAALLGVRYRRISDTEFEHSNVLTLIDRDGRIVHRQVGLDAEPHELVRKAAGL